MASRYTVILRMTRLRHRQFTETALGFSMTILNAGQHSACHLQPAVQSHFLCVKGPELSSECFKPGLLSAQRSRRAAFNTACAS